MESLRGRLTAWLLAGSGLLLVTGGLVLNGIITSRLRRDFDESLINKARALSTLTEQEHGAVWLELTDQELREFAVAAHPEYFQIWSDDGSVVARSRSLGGRDLPHEGGSPDRPRLTDLTLPDGRRGRLVEIDFRPRQDGGEPYDGESAGPLPSRGESAMLSVARGREELEAFLVSLHLFLAALVLALLAGIFALVRLSMKVGLAPLEVLGAQLSSLGAESLGETLVAAEAPAELQPVIARLNDLLRRLKESFERERRFSADLAHELRTPLAELRSMVEVSLRWPEDQATSAGILEEIGKIGQQMERIVINLLALARYDGGQQTVWPAEVPVGELVERCWSPLAAEAAGRGMTLSQTLPAGLTVTTDEDKLALVLSNLFANAVSYGRPGSPVTCSAGFEGGELTLRVSNSTDLLQGEDVPRVFDRFWRKDPARSGGQHAGLGLSLVSALARVLGLTASARLEGGVFEVKLAGPLASPKMMSATGFSA